MEDVVQGVIKQFQYYKSLGERCLERVTEDQLFHQPNEESNSLALIAKHLAGYMLSRWTDFLNSDGEKTWRDRDREFEMDWTNREDVMTYWQKG